MFAVVQWYTFIVSIEVAIRFRFSDLHAKQPGTSLASYEYMHPRHAIRFDIRSKAMATRLSPPTDHGHH
ncbi:GM13711 [Drosophila sechellia]|uniref:GM13711 n=1 Tax=Drosophila sechellia TaxID=7238 RepID=B4IJP6_DROSE|nr:GM13711 [Drosophila sechellia]